MQGMNSGGLMSKLAKSPAAGLAAGATIGGGVESPQKPKAEGGRSKSKSPGPGNRNRKGRSKSPVPAGGGQNTGGGGGGGKSKSPRRNQGKGKSKSPVRGGSGGGVAAATAAAKTEPTEAKKKPMLSLADLAKKSGAKGGKSNNNGAGKTDDQKAKAEKQKVMFAKLEKEKQAQERFLQKQKEMAEEKAKEDAEAKKEAQEVFLVDGLFLFSTTTSNVFLASNSRSASMDVVLAAAAADIPAVVGKSVVEPVETGDDSLGLRAQLTPLFFCDPALNSIVSEAKSTEFVATAASSTTSSGPEKAIFDADNSKSKEAKKSIGPKTKQQQQQPQQRKQKQQQGGRDKSPARGKRNSGGGRSKSPRRNRSKSPARSKKAATTADSVPTSANGNKKTTVAATTNTKKLPLHVQFDPLLSGLAGVTHKKSMNTNYACQVLSSAQMQTKGACTMTPSLSSTSEASFLLPPSYLEVEPLMSLMVPEEIAEAINLELSCGKLTLDEEELILAEEEENKKEEEKKFMTPKKPKKKKDNNHISDLYMTPPKDFKGKVRFFEKLTKQKLERPRPTPVKKPEVSEKVKTAQDEVRTSLSGGAGSPVKKAAMSVSDELPKDMTPLAEKRERVEKFFDKPPTVQEQAESDVTSMENDSSKNQNKGAPGKKNGKGKKGRSRSPNRNKGKKGKSKSPARQRNSEGSSTQEEPDTTKKTDEDFDAAAKKAEEEEKNRKDEERQKAEAEVAEKAKLEKEERVKAEKEAAEKAKAEKEAAEKAKAEKEAAEKAKAEKEAAEEKAKAEKEAAEKAKAEKEAAEKAKAEKEAAEKAKAEKEAAEKAKAEKEAAEKAKAEKEAAEKAKAEKEAAEKAKAEKEAAEKAKAEKEAAEKAKAEKEAAEKAKAEKEAADKAKAEKEAADKAKAEKEAAEKAKAEKEAAEKAKAEKEAAEKAKAEEERAKAEKEAAEKAKAEKETAEKAKAEEEAAAKKAEEERLAAEAKKTEEEAAAAKKKESTNTKPAKEKEAGLMLPGSAFSTPVVLQDKTNKDVALEAPKPDNPASTEEVHAELLSRDMADEVLQQNSQDAEDISKQTPASSEPNEEFPSLGDAPRSIQAKGASGKSYAQILSEGQKQKERSDSAQYPEYLDFIPQLTFDQKVAFTGNISKPTVQTPEKDKTKISKTSNESERKEGGRGKVQDTPTEVADGTPEKRLEKKVPEQAGPVEESKEDADSDPDFKPIKRESRKKKNAAASGDTAQQASQPGDQGSDKVETVEPTKAAFRKANFNQYSALEELDVPTEIVASGEQKKQKARPLKTGTQAKKKSVRFGGSSAKEAKKGKNKSKEIVVEEIEEIPPPPPTVAKPLHILNDLAHTKPICYILDALIWVVVLLLGAPLGAVGIILLTIYKLLVFFPRSLGVGIIQPKKMPDQKLAVVITGCDSGFGKDLAFALLSEGFVVFCGCLRKESLKAFSKHELAVPILMDITKDSDVDNASKRVLDWLSGGDGRILHALVNNAGIGTPGLVDWITVGEMQKMVDVNFLGMVRCTKKFLPHFKFQASEGIYSSGRIVNMVSAAGMVSGGLFSVGYEASKHAAEVFSTNLRNEMKGFGLKVTVINPSFHKTAMTKDLTQDLRKKWKSLPSEKRREYGGEEYINLAANASKVASEVVNWDSKNVIDAMKKSVVWKSPPAKLLVGGDAKYFLILIRMLPTWVSSRLLFLKGEGLTDTVKKSKQD